MIPDVVIVGAGVIGASCAYHLARAGRRVLLLDRAPGPGGGSTARATGGFRAQYATAINIRLSLRARAALRSFHHDTGVDPGFVPVGYLWLASTDAQLAELRTANALQIREGVDDARIVTPDEIAAINPLAGRDGIVGGAWCPSDGVMRPMEILRGYLAAAARLGAELRWDEPVIALEREAAQITHVVTARDSFAAPLVIDAGGPWAASVARLAGVDLPVTPLRRQVAITEPTRALPASFPLTIWLDDGFHLRVRDGRALLLRPTPGDPDDPFCDRVEPAWLDEITAIARVRVPALREVAIDRAGAWAGLYEMSPDGHAIVGRAPGCDNLLVVAGHSGHGVMHAPAIGALVGDLVDGRSSNELHALRPARFADGDAIRGSSLL